MHRAFLILLLATTFTYADDLKLRDGTVYKDAKIVGHDATNVTILYADGGATVPIANLPDDLQKKFGYDSSKAAAPSQDADKKAEWSNYRKVEDKYVLLNGKVVSRQSANVTTLNVKLNHAGEEKDVAGNSLGQGSFVDVYDGSAAAATDPTKVKPTGNTVFLKDYTISSDKIVKVDAVKTGATQAGGVYYVVVEPITFESWKKAGSPQ